MAKNIAKQWNHKGKKCVIAWVGTHYCAYVETKLEDIYYGQEYGSYETTPESNIEAHGGLTFSGKLSEEFGFGDMCFFGCDYAHIGDHVDGMTIRDGDHKWTLDEVEKDTIKMADSTIQYEKIHGEFKKAFEEFKEKLKLIKDDAILGADE